MAASPAQMNDEHMIRNLRQYAMVNNDLTDKCFCSCVNTITSQALTDKERDCIDGCAMKLMKATTRMVMKVAEQNPMGIGTGQQI